ncbi:hypothetical protein FISHEDRAFT_71262 [Fistulina hepatica ATCC 64428]|nr:hypothetical protein FISHEDRAFT_71262 [Fistulina hepatica ATCC 64428]
MTHLHSPLPSTQSITLLTALEATIRYRNAAIVPLSLTFLHPTFNAPNIPLPDGDTVDWVYGDREIRNFLNNNSHFPIMNTVDHGNIQTFSNLLWTTLLPQQKSSSPSLRVIHAAAYLNPVYEVIFELDSSDHSQDVPPPSMMPKRMRASNTCLQASVHVPLPVTRHFQIARIAFAVLDMLRQIRGHGPYFVSSFAMCWNPEHQSAYVHMTIGLCSPSAFFCAWSVRPDVTVHTWSTSHRPTFLSFHCHDPNDSIVHPTFAYQLRTETSALL